MKKVFSISVQTLIQLPRINDVHFNDDGKKIIWSELSDGKGRIFVKALGRESFCISGDHSVHGNVGYGGGDFEVSGNQVFFSAHPGIILKTACNSNASPKPVIPQWVATAAPTVSPDGNWLIFCYSEKEVDGLGITRTHGITWPYQLVMGADFYMQPVWHPSGSLIAWVEWDHPDMPWDASRIKLGELGGMQKRLIRENLIAGGKGHSASQPQFSPDGKWLSYIIRNGDWDELILYNLKRKSKRILINGNGFHLRLPEWIQGMRSYGWNSSGTALFHIRYMHGEATLWKTHIQNGKSEQLDIHPIQWVVQLAVSPKGDDLLFLGSSPKIPKQIQLVRNGKRISSQSIIEKKAGGACTEPVEINFPATDGKTVYGFFYPPLMPPLDKKIKPPLILHIHGGPTSAHTKSFSSEAAFFVSRGFAFAEVNYRGSSGYGYSYQDSLSHQWGVVDVEDTISFAQTLILEGLVDSNKIALMGSSAGGFTVLNALIKKPGFFKVGICSYGVTDLLEDARNTHKFEKYYHRFLTGDINRNRNRFLERSPVNHIEKIKDPVLLFHGDEDRVVSLNQSRTIFEKLKMNGVHCELHIYSGEGHGFRKKETIIDFYKKIEIFLNKHLIQK